MLTQVLSRGFRLSLSIFVASIAQIVYRITELKQNQISNLNILGGRLKVAKVFPEFFCFTEPPF